MKINLKTTNGIDLGDEVRDVVTGFVGVATGCVFYLTGCTQFLLTPAVSDTNTASDGRWFDSDRVVVLKKNAVKLATKVANGCDAAAPVR